MTTNEPRKFRKKPVVIEAMRLTGTPAETHAVYQWIEANTLGSFEPLDVIEGRKPYPASGVSIDPRDGRMIISTLEGLHWADLDDWIIRGVKGEFYPCKPDIFEATYVPSEPNEALPDDVLAEVDPAQLVKRLHAVEQELLRYKLTEITTAEIELAGHEIEVAQRLVGTLTSGDGTWSLAFPAQPGRESDLIIPKALKAGETAVQQWRNTLSQLEETTTTLASVGRQLEEAGRQLDQAHPRVLATEKDREAFHETFEDAFTFIVDGTGAAGRPYIAWMDEDGEIWAQRPVEEDEWTLNRQSVLVDFTDLPLPITVLPARRARMTEDH